MKKQLFSLILALAMLLCIGVVSASAETEVATGTTSSIDMEELLGVTSGELFELYVDNTLYSYSWSTFSDAARENLTDQQKQLYDYAVPFIKSIATGGQASAVIALPADSLRTWGFTIDGSFTASDKDSTIAAANALLEPHLDAVRQALILDMPFDFYWSNASGYGLGYSMSTYTDGSGTFTLMPSFHFGVDADFRPATYDEDNPTVDTSKTAATSTSIEEANAIVEKYKDKSDYEKIIGYIDEICELTDYNTDAALNGSSATDNSPWQLLYVFDDDPSTEVVCEGYAKAFQYLCDLTTFSSDKVESRIVTGNMSGGTGEGPHMWNVVTMNDGNNYIVDVTNSDTGTVGQDGQFKLGGTDDYRPNYDPTNNGTVWGATYVFPCNESQTMYFTYDADLPYNGNQITLATSNYEPPVVTYTVTFYSDPDVVYESFSKPAGYAMPFPDNEPTKTGHSFDGWVYSEGSISTTVPAKDVSFIATWSVNTYFITTDSSIANGSVFAGSSSALYGETVTLTVNPAEGYELDELTVMMGETPVDVNDSHQFTMPAGNVTVTATFKEIVYNIIINATENGTVYPQDDITTVKAGDPARLIILPNSNYALEKLVVNGVDVTAQVDMYGGTYDFEMPAEDVVVKATFARFYTITIHPNGGRLTSEDTDEYILLTDTNGKLTEDKIDGVPVGFFFEDHFISSYNTKDDGSGVTVDLSGTFTSDITVYAIWTENIIKLLKNNTEVSPGDPYASITAGDELTIECNIPNATFQWMNGEELLSTGTNYTVNANDFSEGEILALFIWSDNDSILEKEYYLTYTTPPMEVSVSLNGKETNGEDDIYVGDVISATVTGGDGNPSFKWTNESDAVLATSSSYTVDANDFSSSYEILTLTVYDADDNPTKYYDFYYIMGEYRLTVKANGKDLSDGSLVLNGDVLTVTYNDPAATIFRWTDDHDQELGTGTTYTIPASGLTDTEEIYIDAYNNEGNHITGMYLNYLNSTRPEAGKYLIYKHINPVAGGSIDGPASEAEEGDIITFTLTPADGYRLLTVDVANMDTYAGLPFEHVDDNTYRFTMPSANVQIDATYTDAFLINYADDEFGYFSGADAAQAGDTVSFYAFPYYAHHDVDSITVTGESGKTYPVTGPDYLREYSFVMPSEDVTVSATFKKLEALSAFVSNSTTGEILNDGASVGAEDSLTAYFNGPISYYVKWVAENHISYDSHVIVPDGVSVITLHLYDNDSYAGDPVKTYTFNVAYTVYIDSTTINGTVDASSHSACPDEEITLTITPDEGYELSYINVTHGNTSIDVTDNKFTMPAANVYVYASFIPIDYTITIADSTGGSVAVAGDATTACAGDIIPLTATPNEGYLLESITVMQGETPVNVTRNEYFTMPAGDVTVTATFIKCNTIYFVKPDNWSELNVVALNADGAATSIMNVQLTDDGRYQVQLPTSFVTVLFRNHLNGQITAPAEGAMQTDEEAVVDGKTYYYTHTVTLPVGENYTAVALTGFASPVIDGGSFSFMVNLAYGYQAGSNFAVKANGTPLTPVNGVYTIANITEDQTVTVEGVEEIISISTITIEPAAATVKKGSTQQFTATVTGIGSFDQTVAWTLTGNSNPNTTISADGLLTVAADETATALTVTATANGDPSKTASAAVTVDQLVAEFQIEVTREFVGLTVEEVLQYDALGSIGIHQDGIMHEILTFAADKLTVTSNNQFDSCMLEVFSSKSNIPGYLLTHTWTVNGVPAGSGETVDIIPLRPIMKVTLTTTYTLNATVSFNANGGTGTMENVTGVTGTYTLPPCGFTAPSGKQFKGWALTADGDVITTAAIDVTGDTTLYAIWEDIPAVTYPVTVTGGTGSGDYAEGSSVTITANAPEAGKQFSGWTGLDGLTITLGTATEATVTFTMPAQAVEVTANYEAVPVSSYQVSFDVNGASGAMASISTSAGAYQLPQCTVTAPEGKQFKAWSINGTEYAPGTTITITADTVIKAIWGDVPAADKAPVITGPAAAQNTIGKPGDTVTLSVTATDATSYQWYINRQDGKGYVAIPGATAATYTTSAVNASNSGYTYYCVASNAAGSTQSPVFTLTVELDVPQTGDSANLALWFVLMLLSSAGILMMTVKSRKQN